MRKRTILKGGILVILALVLVYLPVLASAAPAKPIKIGLLVNMTGGLAAYGYSHEKVAKAAIAKINAEGGIAGRPVKLYVEDDESKPSVGALKFRKLVETYGVDFVLDSNSSGVCIACCPIAKELRTLYFPCGSATEISGKKGNRYVFQACTNVREEVKGAARFAVQNLGKKWVTVVADFAWGHSNEKDFARYVAENGGRVLKAIRVPLGTSNWLPYLKGKIPAEAEAVYFANFGSDFLSFIRDLHALRPNIKKLGADYSIAAQDPVKLGTPAEGLYCLTSYPVTLRGLNTPYNKAYRDAIGVDDEGRELKSGKRFVLAYDWAVWEPIFALKASIEESGWKSKKDNPKLIKALESMSFKKGLEFPQGDMHYRAEDHLCITGTYVERITNGKINVVARIPAKDVAYTPPLVDRTKEPF